MVAANCRVAAGAGIGLLVHLDLDLGTSRDLADARNASAAANVAADIVGRDAVDRAVALGTTNAGGSLVSTVHPQLLECGVAESQTGRSQQSQSVLHRVGWKEEEEWCRGVL